MKAKRVLAGILCGFLLFSQTVCVYADEITTEGNESVSENVGGLSEGSEDFKNSGSESVDAVRQDAGTESVDASGQDTGSESVDASGQDTGTESVDASGQDTSTDTVDTEDSADSSDTAGQDKNANSGSEVSQNSGETTEQDTANAESEAAENGESSDSQNKSGNSKNSTSITSDDGTSKSTDDKDVESGSQTDSASKNSTAQKANSTTVEAVTESKKTAVSEDSVKFVSQNEAKEEEDPLADGVSTGDVEYDSIINDPKGYPYVAPASNVYSAMMAMKSRYPEDMTWTNSNLYRSKGYTYQEGRLVGTSGGGCHGFALILSDAAYGSLPLVEHTNFSNIKVGDILRINNDSHSVMITAINGNTITIAEGNYGGKIHWGRTISRTNTTGWSYVISRQRLSVTKFEPYISSSVKYTGTERKPNVYYDYLDQGSDYTVAYRNNINPGTATAIVTGINNFNGTAYLNFNISKASQRFSYDYTATVEEGSTTTIKITGAKTPVSFTSSNTSIATVNSSGVVTGLKRGTVTITATAAETSAYSSYTHNFTIYVLQGDKVKAFVRRLYRTTLERDPDETGLEWWVEELKSGRRTGADVVNGFYTSDELNGRGYNNTKMVELAYQGIMGRTPDATGKAYWVDRMNSGDSYTSIVNGFIDSPEFEGICSDYGIVKGTPSSSNSSSGSGSGDVSEFVSRLYTKALNRQYDPEGLEYWTNNIKNDSSRGNVLNVALNGFLHSGEFLGKNLNDGEYIKVLYRTFLGREPESEGYNYWVNILASGTSRDEVASGFAYSDEFNGIMSSYGL